MCLQCCHPSQTFPRMTQTPSKTHNLPISFRQVALIVFSVNDCGESMKNWRFCMKTRSFRSFPTRTTRPEAKAAALNAPMSLARPRFSRRVQLVRASHAINWISFWPKKSDQQQPRHPEQAPRRFSNCWRLCRIFYRLPEPSRSRLSGSVARRTWRFDREASSSENQNRGSEQVEKRSRSCTRCALPVDHKEHCGHPVVPATRSD